MTITVHVNPEQEKKLGSLANAQGKDLSEFVQTLVEDFLALQSWPKDTPEEWAEASVAMTSELFDDESWDEVK